MYIITALLLPIIVFSHLAAQWYLFHFIGYIAVGWMRGRREAVASGREAVASAQWSA
jgi:hypothetical protein